MSDHQLQAVSGLAGNLERWRFGREHADYSGGDEPFHADRIGDLATVMAETIDAFRILTDGSGNAAEPVAAISVALGVHSFTEMPRRR